MKRIIQTIILTLITLNSFSLGLRSMVAVPIAEGDFVFRMMNNSLNKPYMDALGFGLAYGLPNDGALFIGMPYRLTPAGPNRTGNVSALYRYIIKREDRKDQPLASLFLYRGNIYAGMGYCDSQRHDPDHGQPLFGY